MTTPAEAIEHDVSRLFTDLCPYCNQPYQGEFDEASWRYQTQYFCFDRETNVEWGEQDHFDEDCTIHFQCTECGNDVPSEMEAIIAIYRGNITLYNNPEPRT